MKGIPFFCNAAMLILQHMLKEWQLKVPFNLLPSGFFAAHEKEVLVLMWQGLSTKQIADALRLSYHTVTKYRQNLMYETGMRNDAALSMFAVLHQVYTPWVQSNSTGGHCASL